jgi:hypothetical protein
MLEAQLPVCLTVTIALLTKREGEAMWDLSFVRFHLQRVYIAVLISLVAAVVLGAVVGVGWRAESAQCLAVPGGFQKILAGTCPASIP